jgi:hypothetical protein
MTAVGKGRAHRGPWTERHVTRGALEELRAAHDIADLIRRLDPQIRFERTGHELRALCPFHKERTPSFYAIPRKRMFHCFGCGAHGDVFEVVRRYQGCSFLETVEYLGGTRQMSGPGPEHARLHDADAGPGLDGGQQEAAAKVARARGIFDKTVSARGTLVEVSYLPSRGILPDRWPDGFRASSTAAEWPMVGASTLVPAPRPTGRCRSAPGRG